MTWGCLMGWDGVHATWEYAPSVAIGPLAVHSRPWPLVALPNEWACAHAYVREVTAIAERYQSAVYKGTLGRTKPQRP